MQWLLVFMGIVVSDIFWVYCVRSVQATHPLAAGLWAVGIFIPTAAITVAYVQNPWLLIPAGLGHFCGTFLPVWWEKHKNETKLLKLFRRATKGSDPSSSDDA